ALTSRVFTLPNPQAAASTAASKSTEPTVAATTAPPAGLSTSVGTTWVPTTVTGFTKEFSESTTVPVGGVSTTLTVTATPGQVFVWTNGAYSMTTQILTTSINTPKATSAAIPTVNKFASSPYISNGTLSGKVADPALIISTWDQTGCTGTRTDATAFYNKNFVTSVYSYQISRDMASWEQLDFSWSSADGQSMHGQPQACSNFLERTNPDSNGNMLHPNVCYGLHHDAKAGVSSFFHSEAWWCRMC
ncbi:MAG: hypothetical protein Q9164_006846, partial [Protoblastenia rupestris]